MKKQTFIATYILFFLLMMMLGSVYTYSIYRTELETTLDINTTLSGLPYMTSLAFFALSMFYFGKYNTLDNAKRLSMLGGGLLVSAWLISGATLSIWILIISYGVMMGSAVGILYGIPLMLINNQDIERKGFYSGLMLFAFGLSSVIFSPIARRIIDTYDLQTLFYVYAIISVIVSFSLILLLPRSKTPSKKSTQLELPPWGKYFFLLTAMTFVGLMMIGLTNVIATQNYNFESGVIAIIISVFALLNASSRPLFGFLMDKLSFKRLGFMSISLIIFASIINIVNQGENLVLFFIGYGLYWFNLGVWLTLMPIYVKQEVGEALYASVYGKVYLGYGVSALIGTLFSSLVLEILGTPLLIYVGIILWMGFMTLYLSKKI